MNNSAQKKLESILSSLDSNKVSEAKNKLNGFMNTPEGQKIAREIGGMDKNKLINTFMTMNTSEIKSKLKNADLSKLSSKDIETILNKLK